LKKERPPKRRTKKNWGRGGFLLETKKKKPTPETQSRFLIIKISARIGSGEGGEIIGEE